MAMTQEEKNFHKISSKLDVMISLLYDLKESFDRKNSTKEKVHYLAGQGLNNFDVAKIIGISEKHVSKEKSSMKKNG